MRKTEEQIKKRCRDFYYILKSDEVIQELEDDERNSFKYGLLTLLWTLVEPERLDGEVSIDIGENIKINPSDYI